MDKERSLAELAEVLRPEQLSEDVPMALHTSFRVGGPAALLVQPGSAADVAAAVGACRRADADFYILGNGSNLIVRDGGYDGVIIKLGDQFSRLDIQGTVLTAEAGALLSTVARYAADHGLAGMEFAGGIPGSIGGAVAMNAGAYGGEIKDIVMEASCLYPDGSVRLLGAADLEMAYRHSICQDEGLVVLSASFRLQPGATGDIKRAMQDFLKLRNDRQPVQWPSAGSVFKRPEGHYAGRLIEDAGLKGLALGGARVSPLHAGFIINENKATADDILKLIELIKLTVFDNSGVLLQEEVKVIGKKELME